MNKVFRVIWNEITQTWVAVSEHTKARGKRCSGVSLMAVLGLFSSSSLALAAVAPDTLPGGQQVVAGQADFTQNATSLLVRQHTQKLITQWQDFSIGENATVQFIQPNSDSAALNRVVGQSPSEILGQLSANGHVLLINPNGVVFGANSRIDVASLSASTLDLADADFLNGKLHFTGDNGGLIQADGTINIGEGGRVAFIAPLIEHNGTINAPSGEVIAASGTDVELDVSGDGLVSFRINQGALNAVIENGGGIHVGGGAVLLSAKGFSETAQAVVNNTGVIEATGISREGGRIMLGAGPGGDIDQAGTLDVSSDIANGGLVTLEADTITLAGSSNIDATGATGGGNALVGGDWQGGQNAGRRVFDDPAALQQATRVTVESGARIDASATKKGDGGTVVVWSDIRQADSVTDVKGSISANGGGLGGDGGQVETSGRILNVEGAAVSTAATQGATGDWLLDPGNITIAASGSGGVTSGSEPSGNTIISTATLNAALNSNNVTLTTGAGGFDITLQDDFNYTGAASSLTLDAGRTINLNGFISSSNALDLNFKDGVRLFEHVTINSAGGDVTFDSSIDGFSNLTINSGAGDIALQGNVGSNFPIENLVLNSSGSIFLSQNNAPITVSSYGTQTYTGAVVLRGSTTIDSRGQTAANLGTYSSDGELNLLGQSARLRVTLQGGTGGSGGKDVTDGAPGASGQRAQFQLRVEDQNLSIGIGKNGASGTRDGKGTAGATNRFGYNGGNGGSEGGRNVSGDGGAGGSAAVVRFSSSGDLVAGGGGGGGGAENRDSGSSGSSNASSTVNSIVGGQGGTSNDDHGGGGGGGGGLRGGAGANSGASGGGGGSAGSSGATSVLSNDQNLAVNLEGFSLLSSSGGSFVTFERLAVPSGVTFNGSVTGNHALRIDVGNGGGIQMNAAIDTGTAGQVYNAPVNLGGNSAFKGTNISAGTINLAAHELIIDEADQTTGAIISGVVSGSGKLIKRGDGLLILQAVNTYSGGTDIEAGIAQSQRSNFGAPSSGTFGSGTIAITQGGGLDLKGTILVNPLNLSGSGFNNSGALFNSSANFSNWESGAITLTGDAVVSASSISGGGLILNSEITGPHKLTLNHQGQTVYLRQAANIGALVSDGPLGVEANVTSSGTDGQQYNGATTFSDNIELAATNGTIGGSGLITANRLNFALNSASVDLSNRNNNFAGAIAIAGKDAGLGQNVDLVNRAGLTFAGAEIAGNLSTTTGTAGSTGGISQTGALKVGGTSQFIADTLVDQDADLQHTDNNFGGSVSFTPANAGSWRNISIVDGIGGLILGNLTATGTLNATSRDGALTQAGGSIITVDGMTNLLAQSIDGNTDYDITLNGANNDFKDAVNATGKDITLVDGIGGITLGNIDASGNVDVTSNGGAIGQAAGSTIEVDGTTDLLAQSADGMTDYDITLNDANNDFKDTVNATGEDITLVDGTGGIALGNVDASGKLDVTSNDGAITQTAGTTIEVTGTTDLLAQSVDGMTDYDITLNGTNNDFKDAVNATGEDITLVDGTGGITLGNVDASGKLDVTSHGGAIGQATGSTIDVDGTTDLLAQSADGSTDYDITLDGANNDFKDAVNATGEDITLLDGAGGITLGSVDASGKLDVTSHGGAIGQAAGSTIEVDGATDLLAQSANGMTDYDITLNGANNDFKDSVNATGNNLSIRDRNDLKLSANASGDLVAQSGGNLDATLDVAGNSSLSNSGGGSITAGGNTGSLNVDSSGDVIFRPTTVSGNADINSQSNIREVPRFALDTQGELTLNAQGFTNVGQVGGSGPDPAPEALIERSGLSEYDSTQRASDGGFYEGSPDILRLETRDEVVMLDVRSIDLVLTERVDGMMVEHRKGVPIVTELKTGLNLLINQDQEILLNLQSGQNGELIISKADSGSAALDSRGSAAVLASHSFRFTTLDGRNIQFTTTDRQGRLAIESADGLSSEVLQQNRDTLVPLILAQMLRRDAFGMQGGVIAAAGL